MLSSDRKSAFRSVQACIGAGVERDLGRRRVLDDSGNDVLEERSDGRVAADSKS